jgi:hypothetical protein
LANPITYIPRINPRFTASGIFDEAYSELVVIDGVPVTQTMPVLGIRLGDFLEEPKQDDKLIARGRVYKVREMRPDGHGGAKLMLNFDNDVEPKI